MNRSTPPGSSILARAVSSNEFLAATLSLAASLRVVHILDLRRLPLFDGLIIDSRVYDNLAQRIAAGHWMGGERAFYHDPLYSYFLAGIYVVFGHNLLLVRLVQAAIGVATCGLAAVIGRRIFGRGIGNLAAFFVAVYKPAIFQEGEIEKTALGVFLVTAALALAMGTSLGARLAAGAALGLAALTRGNLLLLAPLGAVFFLTEPGPARVRGTNGKGVAPGWGKRLAFSLRGHPGRSAAVFLVGFSAVLAPVAWRNHRVSGEWILTTSGVGQAFYVGNNPDNLLGSWRNVPFVRADGSSEEADFQAMAEARLGRRLRPTEVSAYWLAEGWHHILANPVFAARVMLKKFALFWSNYEAPDAWDMYFLARYSFALRLPLLSMGWVLPLAVLGAMAGFREKRGVRLLVGFGTAYCLAVITFFVFSRFRLHVVPALAVLGASAVPWLAAVVRSRDVRRGVPAGVVAASVALFSFFGVSTFYPEKAESVQNFINLAGLYQQERDPVSAVRILNEALEKVPGNAAVICELGRLYLSMGDVRQAHMNITQCIMANPQHPGAWLALGQVYDAIGKPAEAAQAYRKQLEVLPGLAAAERFLAEAELRTGNIASGADHLAALVARRGEDPRINLTLVAGLLAAGRAEEARAVLRRSAARGWPASKEDVDREYKRLFGRGP